MLLDRLVFLIYGAEDIKDGLYPGDPISQASNNIQGHGLVNLKASLASVLDRAAAGIHYNVYTKGGSPK